MNLHNTGGNTNEDTTDLDDGETIEELEGSKGTLEKMCRTYEKIYRTTLTLAGKKDLTNLIKTIADEAKKLMDASDCTVYLADYETELLKPFYTNDRRYKEEIMSYDIPFGEGEAGRVVITGETRYLNIGSERDHLVTIPGTEDDESENESILTVPLFGKEKVIGVLSLGKIGYRFDDDDVEKLKTFAKQAEVAIQRVNEIEELKESKNKVSEQKQKIESLHRVAGDLEKCGSVDEIYAITMEAVKNILDFYICTIMIYEDGRLVVKSTNDEGLDVGDEFSTDRGAYGRTFREKKSYIIDDLTEEREAEPTTEEFRSALSVPIGDTGVFHTLSDKVGYFEEDDLEITELLISHVNEAINRIRNRKMIEDRKEKLEALHDIAARLESCSSEQKAYEMIVDASEKILKFDMCRVHIAEGDRLVVKATSSKITESEEKKTMPLNEGVAGKTYLNNESYVISDFKEDDGAVPFIKEYRSGISVPIGIFGVFQAVSYDTDDFDQEDVELAELLASHLTEALNRIRSEKRERFLLTLLRHDLKNKSQIVRGYLQILKDLDLTEEQNRFIDRAVKANMESQELLSKIGVLKDIEKEKEMEAIPLDYIINTALDENDEIVRSNGIKIDFIGSDLEVMGGPLLEELFSNLIENAVKHADCEVIKISAEEEMEMVRVKVEDDGVGISKDIKDKVLKRGFKGKNSEGLGIGTFLVKNIAKMYKGYIEVKDSEMGGARFDVVLRKA